jgi:hypothetical protein
MRRRWRNWRPAARKGARSASGYTRREALVAVIDGDQAVFVAILV